jgi:hypothetical protein
LAESPREDAVADGVAARLELGFRGVAAGFQPPVRAFLSTHQDLLRGVTSIDDAAAFPTSIAEMRPDYLLVGEIGGDDNLRDVIGPVAGMPQRPVLMVGEVSADTMPLPSGMAVDAVGRDAGAFEVALVLRALMRRTRPQAMVGRTTWHDLGFDEACLTFSVRDRAVALSLEAAGVLGLMMDDPDRVWDRATLHRLVFGSGSVNDIRSIDMRISRARRLVSAALGCDPIRTVRGIGYALVPRP